MLLVLPLRRWLLAVGTFADHAQVELRAPATERLRPIEDVLGLDESKSEQPSFTDTQIIDQLIGQELRNPFVLLNPTSNNLIWVNPVAPSQKATLPFRYGMKRCSPLPAMEPVLFPCVCCSGDRFNRFSWRARSV